MFSVPEPVWITEPGISWILIRTINMYLYKSRNQIHTRCHRIRNHYIFESGTIIVLDPKPLCFRIRNHYGLGYRPGISRIWIRTINLYLYKSRNQIHRTTICHIWIRNHYVLESGSIMVLDLKPLCFRIRNHQELGYGSGNSRIWIRTINMNSHPYS